MGVEREQGSRGEGAGCRRFEMELAAYLEGENLPAVYAHAQECPLCGVVLADLEAIRLASRQMTLEEPPARVWSNIRAQLASEEIFRQPARGWRRWLQFSGLLPHPAPVAALAGLVAFGAFLLVHPGVFQKKVAHPPAQTVNLAATSPAFSAEDEDVAHAIGEMEKSYRAAEQRLDPAVKVVYQKGLESLDSSIDECRASVQREPTNDLAHEYLLSAYAQKADVLASALEFEGR
jgi:hypothetical protein